jgi:uncharacterized protein (DUF3084 family)
LYGPVLIAVLIVLGGVIAYAGDWIGRRVGRQRLTLFGLRPKHTSIVVAVITGVMVVGTTLATLIIVDNDFREMLVDYGSVKTELVATQGSLSLTQEQLREAEGRLAEKLNELARKEEEVIGLETQIGELKVERDGLIEDIRQLQVQLDTLLQSHLAAQEVFGEQYRSLWQGVTQGTIIGIKGALVRNFVLQPGDVQALDRHLDELARHSRDVWRKEFEVVPGDRKAAREVVNGAADRVLVRVLLAENVYQEDELTSAIRANLTVDQRRRVFSKNDRIAWSESPVDPAKATASEIMAALSRVGEAARRKAIQEGVYVDTADETVGIDLSNTVDELVSQIMKLSEPVWLYMKANEDVYNTDGPIDWSFGFSFERD